jgi:hypothetical protein
MESHVNREGYNVVPARSGRQILASVMWKWHPYHPAVIARRAASGLTPKAGWHEVTVVAGAGCKRYMKGLLQRHFEGGAPYTWPQYPPGNWKHSWAYADGMHLWLAVHDVEQADALDPDILDEALRLMHAYIDANPSYFAPVKKELEESAV